MAITFRIVDQDGRTPVEDPRREALAYMGRLQAKGISTRLMVRNGEYTVWSDCLMTLIFVPLEDNQCTTPSSL
jgi:hypothetical protein